MALIMDAVPNSKVHGANVGPIWGREDRSGAAGIGLGRRYFPSA